MKKKVFGRQFKRDTNERKALFKGLMSDLVMLESIKTTLPKAKAIKGQVEKLVTKAKVRGVASRQFISPYLSAKAADKVIVDLSVRFADRPGGYTRIVKLGSRFSDNADMAIIEWVEKVSEATQETNIKVSKSNVKDTVEAEIVAPKKATKKVSKNEKKEKPTKTSLKTEKKKGEK